MAGGVTKKMFVIAYQVHVNLLCDGKQGIKALHTNIPTIFFVNV